MSDESGLTRVGPVVVLSGSALRLVLECAAIAVRHRKMTAGLPFSTQPYEALACEFGAAMAAAGHSDVRSPAISKAVAVEHPTVPLAEAAARLGISLRQARRRAPQLAGRKVAGRWLVALGAVLLVAGGLLVLSGRLGGTWRPLPGDLVIRRPGVVVFLPLTTMLLLSLLGSLVLWVLRRLRY